MEKRRSKLQTYLEHIVQDNTLLETDEDAANFLKELPKLIKMVKAATG